MRSLADLEAAYSGSAAPTAPPGGTRSLADLESAYGSPGEAQAASPYDDAPAAGKPGLLEAGLRGIKQGVTLGFGDEATGALESLLTSKTYKQARDEARASDAAAQKAHPWGFGLGEALGGLATPGIGEVTGVIKGAGLAAHAARGAAVGIASGIGNSEAESVEGIAHDAGKSGLLGAGLGAVLGKAGERLFQGAPERSSERLLSDLGDRANKSVRDKMAMIPEHVEETARKFGLDKFAREPGELLDSSTAARKQVGEAIGQTYETVDKAFLGVKTSDVLHALGETKKAYSNPADKAFRKQIESLQDEVRSQWGSAARDRVPLADVNKLASRMEQSGFASADIAPGPAKQLSRDIAKNVNSVLEKRMDEIQGFAGHVKAAPSAGASEPLAESMTAADQLKGLKELNRNYRSLKLIEKAADQRAKLGAFRPNGIRQIASSGLEATAGLASIATGNPLPYLAAKVGVPLAKEGARAADEILSKLSLAARSGLPTAQLVQRAIEAGIPRTTIATTVAASKKDKTGG